MRPSVAILAALAFVGPVHAQETRQLTADDYARAERFLGAHTGPLVYGASVRPEWLADGRFWYRSDVPGGSEYIVVDPDGRERGRAFDHERIAAALSAAARDSASRNSRSA